jgi:Ras-related protein Rab-27B
MSGSEEAKEHPTFEILHKQPTSPRPSSLQLRSNRFPPYSTLNADYIMKLITLGDTGVGKTSFLYSLLREPTSHYTTIGVDMITKYLLKDSETVVKTHIWDTAGQEAFRSIITAYFRTVCGGFLIFDVTRPATLYNLRKWISQSRQYLPETSKCSFIVIGTKTDLSRERRVYYEEGEQFAREFNLPYYECSPKTGKGVNTAFLLCIETIWKRYIERNPTNEWIGIRKTNATNSIDEPDDIFNNSSRLDCCHLL